MCPVFLGLVNLEPRPLLRFRARFVKMVCLSWAGVGAEEWIVGGDEEGGAESRWG